MVFQVLWKDWGAARGADATVETESVAVFVAHMHKLHEQTTYM
jgi:hypothetical protein